MALRPEDLSEEEMLAAEALILELAARAYTQAMAASGSVVMAMDGRLIQQFADAGVAYRALATRSVGHGAVGAKTQATRCLFPQWTVTSAVSKMGRDRAWTSQEF